MTRWIAIALALACAGGCSKGGKPEGSGPEIGQPNGGQPEGGKCPAFANCHPSWKVCNCQFNAKGSLLKVEADFQGDGSTDYRMTYFYDDQDNLLRWENDRGADGKIELRCVFHPPCPPPHPAPEGKCSCIPE